MVLMATIKIMGLLPHLIEIQITQSQGLRKHPLQPQPPALWRELVKKGVLGCQHSELEKFKKHRSQSDAIWLCEAINGRAAVRQRASGERWSGTNDCGSRRNHGPANELCHHKRQQCAPTLHWRGLFDD